MVEIRDVLLKAAEDVTQGMWCRSYWFADETGETAVADGSTLFNGVSDFSLDQALKARRCAEGSVAVAAKLLGGSYDDYTTAVGVVSEQLPPCNGTGCGRDMDLRYGKDLFHFNDVHLPDDPFEAGQQLAELFRTTAETL